MFFPLTPCSYALAGLLFRNVVFPVRLLDLDIQDGQDRLDKERKKLDRQIETIQGQYRQALEAEEKEAGYGR